MLGLAHGAGLVRSVCGLVNLEFGIYVDLIYDMAED